MAWYDWVILSVLAVLLTVAAIQTAVGYVKEQRRRRDAYKSIDEEPFEIPEPTLVRAKVISKRVEMEHGGSYKTPTHRLVYYVGFETADSQRLELTVDEETFQVVFESQEGDLLTVDGMFFAFGDGQCV